MITTGKTHDLRVARQLAFEPGTVLVLDRGYIDYQWFVELSQRQVYFVTRLKENAVYEVVQRRAVPQHSNVIADEVIFFSSQAQPSKEYFFRRVEIDDPEQGRLVFLTNHHKLGAATVAAIYKDRWQVELFFKALKQNLRIKTFVGTSSNAVRTQVWTALIAMLLLRYFAVAGQVRLVVVEPGGAVAAAAIRAPRGVEVAGRTVPTAAGVAPDGDEAVGATVGGAALSGTAVGQVAKEKTLWEGIHKELTRTATALRARSARDFTTANLVFRRA